MAIIEIPKDVAIDISGGGVMVRGKLGTVKRALSTKNVELKQENSKVIVNALDKRKKTAAMAGTVVSHLNNMIKGVTEGWQYTLKILYLHFPMGVKTEKDKVVISNFLGERTPRIAKIAGDTKIEVKGDQIFVTGPSIDDVSRTASNIEMATRIKAYDRRVFQDGIFITSKGG